MSDTEQNLAGAKKWITERFAEVLGLTPENLDWDAHNVGLLLHMPVADGEIHHVVFDRAQLAGHGKGTWDERMRKWIAEHAKEAKRSPSSKTDPHKCPVEDE